MISSTLDPVVGFTRAYKLAKNLNNEINYSSFLNGVIHYKPILFRQFYEATLNGVPNKSLKRRIMEYGS